MLFLLSRWSLVVWRLVKKLQNDSKMQNFEQNVYIYYVYI